MSDERSQPISKRVSTQRTRAAPGALERSSHSSRSSASSLSASTHGSPRPGPDGASGTVRHAPSSARPHPTDPIDTRPALKSRSAVTSLRKRTRASLAGSGLAVSSSRSRATTVFGPAPPSRSSRPDGHTACGGAANRSPAASTSPPPSSTRSLSSASPWIGATTELLTVSW